VEIFGYIASVIIGIALGLIGGGGSILTVPVLVYLFHIEPVTATAYSLFIVGTTSLAGAIPKFRQNEVNLRTAFAFGLPSIIAVFLTRKYVLPAIPEEIFRVQAFILTKGVMLMVLFALLMVYSSFSMIRKNKSHPELHRASRFNYPVILAEGLVVGLLTGLVGAGGGFLIIPALVIFTGLSMKEAIGTSLVIIAAKSLIGFTGDISRLDVDWNLLLKVTGLAIAGIFIGNRISRHIEGEKLKKAFGWFVLAMGVYILLNEVFLK
jgi:uncharacterized membrane protein YfcA